MINIQPTEFKISLDIKGATDMYCMIEQSIEHWAKDEKASDYEDWDNNSIEGVLSDRFYLLKQLDTFLNMGAYRGILNRADSEFKRQK